jgi:hypothetical protein
MKDRIYKEINQNKFPYLLKMPTTKILINMLK